MPSTRRAFLASVGGLGTTLLGGCAARRVTAGPKHAEYGTATPAPTRGTAEHLTVTRSVESSELTDGECVDVAANAVGERVERGARVQSVRDSAALDAVTEPAVLVGIETYYGRHGAYQRGPSADFDGVVEGAPATVDVTLRHENDGGTVQKHECTFPVVVRHVGVYDT
ncbi:hypothetical protein [Halogeometricum limi]|uniref:Uncharacterized protein n=1 Tax=Halogeometricum limi TaxID=555875 RepID=A0A1I6H7H0_9EURY|nr:hypothetical protein [Halogeometricum limi]SFR50392.1 hypothetical protein SAMN04488124_1877 [Halogeometricum limi]